MSTSTIKATIERRILVNYRVDPDALSMILPKSFRPALVGGFGVAGICLIRLGGTRPAGLPAALGITSENAAHRVAVEWDTDDGPVTGVYIPRRDTSSHLGALFGGRVFPGWQHRARFRVEEGEGCYRVDVSSYDGDVHTMAWPWRPRAGRSSRSTWTRCGPVSSTTRIASPPGPRRLTAPS